MADAAAAFAAASSATVAAVESTPAAPAPASSSASAAAAAPMPTCMQLLGPAPVVDSLPALESFASQLHVLTTPLPSSHSEAQLSALEELAMGSLERLDEFSALVEALKHGAAQADGQVLPLMLAAQAQLPPLFQRVHTFAKYAQALETQMSAVEKRVHEVDTLLRRTAAMETEYARNRTHIARHANGVSTQAQKQESSAKTLFSSLFGLGGNSNKTAVPATAAATAGAAAQGVSSGSSTASASASASDAAPSVLDLMDEWKPFDASMQLVDIDEWFAAK